MFNQFKKIITSTSLAAFVAASLAPSVVMAQGTVTLDQMITVPEQAWSKGGSRMFLNLGASVSFGDLLQGIVVQSGNDACITVAAGLWGSEAACVAEMNQTARKMGAKGTHFLNSTGWPDPGHVSTARDILLFGIRTLEDFPEFYQTYYSQLEFTHNKIRQMNRNPLLYTHTGDGLKTGHSDAGGYGLLGSGMQGDRRLIFVVNGLKNMKQRAEASKALLAWGFQFFQNHMIAHKDKVVGYLPVQGGVATRVSLQSLKTISVTLPRYVDLQGVKQEIRRVGAALMAPLKAGSKVAELVIHLPDGQTMVHDLVAGEDVVALGLFAGLWRKMTTWFWQGQDRAP